MKEEFLQKLKALLSEYRVTIGFSVGEHSDAHGLYGETMVISHRINPDGFMDEDWLEVEGWIINQADIPATEGDAK